MVILLGSAVALTAAQYIAFSEEKEGDNETEDT